MKEGFKRAFGATMGFIFATTLMEFVRESILKWGASDEEFMKFEEKHNPKLYNDLNKYRPK